MDIIEFINSRYFLRMNTDGELDVFTTNSGNTALTPASLRSAYEAEYATESEKLNLGDYRDALTSALEQEEKKREIAYRETREKFPSNEVGYIKKVLEMEGISSNARCSEFKRHIEVGRAPTIGTDDIEVMLKAALDPYNRSVPPRSGIPKFKSEAVISNFKSMCLNGSHSHLADLRILLKHKPDNVAILHQWIDDLIKVLCIKTDKEVARVVLLHMMWQIKRRVYSNKVKNDLWVSFYGAQGKGKTYTMRHCIFKALADFTVETELSKIDDIDREIKKFTDNFVVNFEELAVGKDDNVEQGQNRVNKKTMTNIKSILTKDKLQIRKMGGQEQMVRDKTFVPISTANEHLYDVIYDETGMRRYFELELDNPVDKNGEAMKQFDNAEIKRLGDLCEDAWCGVDENCDLPVWDWESDVGKRISAIQQSYRPHTNVDEWLDFGCYVADDDVERGQPGKALYDDYKAFCDDSNYRPKTRGNFVKDLQGKFEFVHLAGRGTYFKCSKEREIVKQEKIGPSVARPRITKVSMP